MLSNLFYVCCTQTFHILKPIKCNVFKANLLRRMQASKAKLKDGLDKTDLDLDDVPLYSCTCENYMHYAWCIHVNLRAFADGIMLDYPTLLDPRKIKAVGKGRACTATMGRPAKARRGGGLGHD